DGILSRVAIAPIEFNMAYLVIAAHGKEPYRQKLSGEAITLGRAISCEVWVDDARLSRHQCRLTREQAGWFIEDLQSTNGTWMDDQRVTRQSLGDGASFEAGDTRFIFHAGEFIANRPRDPLEAKRSQEISATHDPSQETIVAHPIKINGREMPVPKPRAD